ncbi:MAG: hypothetical protein QXV22_05070 [Thermoplasmataceae archaeon]
MSFIISMFTAVHGVLGILWIVSGLVLIYALRSEKDNYLSARLVKMGIMLIRAFGGLTIILGIVVSALLEANSMFPAIASTSGILLTAGIVIAFVTYIILYEGFLFRLLRNTEGGRYKTALNASVLSVILVIVVLILMVAASM